MTFLGLSLGQLLALFGVAGASVIALYLLKLRRRVIVVPFAPLWDALLSERQTSRLSRILTRFWSLLLSLIVVAALTFALGDPRFQSAAHDGRTLVLLIDASLSMQATDVSPSRLEVAKGRARETIRNLGPADRALIAVMQDETLALTAFSDEAGPLLDAIDRVGPVDVAADLGAALRFCRNVLRDQPSPEILLFSDGRFSPLAPQSAALHPIRFSFEPIGSRGRNIGIAAFAARRYPLDKSRVEILLDVRSASSVAERIDVTLLAGGEPIEIKRMVLPPGEHQARFLPDVPGVDADLEARISFVNGARDDLPADDRAFARLPPRRRVRVLSVSKDNLYVSAALLLDESLDVIETTPSNYRAALRRGPFDVVLFDAWTPPELPDAHALWIAPQPGPAEIAPFEIQGAIPRPFFEQIDRRHPIVQWTALENVNIGEAISVRLRPGDRVVAGDHRGPLIVSGTRNGKKFVALTFDIRKSDLPLRVAWPLVLLHAIDGFSGEDDRYIPTYVAGETARLPLPAAATRAEVIDPSGTAHEVPIEEERAVFRPTHAGFHRLRAGGAEASFAVNPSPEEGVLIAAVPNLTVGGASASKPSEGQASVRRELWIYVVAGVFLLLVLEWWTYHRRWTV